MGEQTTIPEPPDGHALYWPAADTGEYPVVMVRDDRLAKEWGEGEARWFEPNTAGEPMTYTEMCEHSDREGYPMSEAVHLVPAPERVGDHVREPGGYCRTCSTVHTEPEWRRAAERAAAAAGVPEGVGASGD